MVLGSEVSWLSSTFKVVSFFSIPAITHTFTLTQQWLQGYPRLRLHVPILSGRCCSMLEESSRSSKASHPEISVSSVSIRFLAKSKYRNWRSFPRHCEREDMKTSITITWSHVEKKPDMYISLSCSHPWYRLEGVVIQPQFFKAVNLFQNLRLTSKTGESRSTYDWCSHNARILLK